jgi:hypothetical protein
MVNYTGTKFLRIVVLFKMNIIILQTLNSTLNIQDACNKTHCRY